MIPVTKPFLAPKELYDSYLEGIWKRNWLTNMGPLASELEVRIKERLQVKHTPIFVTNGTIALQMAIKALELKGEIITTPFSFIATVSSIAWEGCKPIFVDIKPDSLNLDAEKIEAAITENTCAILATHVYGNPCDIDKIQKIAQNYNLKVIYDGAHSFDVKIRDKSVFDFGDISICSLHATKLYHSIEGGLVFSNDPQLLKKITFMRNFGFNGPEKFEELGINGKNSEFHAAMGLVNLDFLDSIVSKRLNIIHRYKEKLSRLGILFPVWHNDSSNNGAYFPVIFESEEVLIKCMNFLKLKEIYTRRYFFPSLASILPYLDPVDMPITEEFSRRVLCLPLYFDLTTEEVDLVCRTISRALEK